MWDWIDSASYVAHGFCLLWQPWLIALYAGSDALIFLAYSAIPFALIRFVRLRPDFGYRRLMLLFAAFILLCGLTHLISIVTLWYPVYTLHGAAKLVTGAVSLATAALLFPLVPAVARLPSPAQLQTANDRLLAEASAHERTLNTLREARSGLEIRVAERTAALKASNERLEIAGREAVHRAKNLFAVVASLARQTARDAGSVEQMSEALLGRIAALAAATDAILPDTDGGHADLRTVAEGQLASYLTSYAGRITLAGPELSLGGDTSRQVALALHELATNAVKYGALAGESGTVSLDWQSDAAGRVTLRWQEQGVAGGSESGGQPLGFGSQLLLHAIPQQLGGEAARAIEGDRLHYELSFPGDHRA